MIDKKDLRIGNLVEWNNLTASIRSTNTTIVSLDHSIDNLALYESINPIPITPEWLERLGFEKGISHQDFYGWRQPNINKCFLVVGDEIRMTSPLLDGALTIFKGLKYIHQLQNLYHALTGQELTVKELTPTL